MSIVLGVRWLVLSYRAGSFPPRAAVFQAWDATGVFARVLDSGEAATFSSDSVVVSGVGKTQVALDYAERVGATVGRSWSCG
ncbi:hypothetical protein SAMN05216215_103327 [Saccharopolyspora shandongensis]|uniref:Uncharacterized protein n=1 Tax=Saccharopolyspora shandongensis TaxID=418495 RepID=A0A1H3M2N1_9PSEU|nr:hypothetical protein [Saccharopolyspora shandongensis]SDY70826.1 hypothetical protein SAMN05216215_103327 [Saccharopolyspora shandongensis]